MPKHSPKCRYVSRPPDVTWVCETGDLVTREECEECPRCGKDMTRTEFPLGHWECDPQCPVRTAKAGT